MWFPQPTDFQTSDDQNMIIFYLMTFPRNYPWDKLTCEETVRSDGNLSSSLPNLVGWLGYWVRQYSSRAHCDFSCRDSMCVTSDRPQASERRVNKGKNQLPADSQLWMQMQYMVDTLFWGQFTWRRQKISNSRVPVTSNQ